MVDDASQTGSVMFLSGDLIFASRVRAAAENAGLAFELSGSVPTTARPDLRWVIIDLATRSGALAGLMDACGSHAPAARVVAYAPHVQVPKLKAAREAGVPVVLTRGQFDGWLTDGMGGQPREL